MVHPNLARGDGPGTVFHEFTWDKVNVFNGNLRTDLILGGSYPVSPVLSYRLRLSYNSNVWDFHQAADGTVTAVPMSWSNAGMGWDLTLGRLVPPSAPGNSLQRWIYLSETGTASPFYETLHPDETSIVPGVFYSRDSTYLRFRKLDAYTAVVELPEGVTKTFLFDAAGNDWRLDKVTDPHGNGLSIRYGAGVWMITDTHGRAHQVHFTSDPAQVYPELIDRVEVAAFGGTTATYELSYTTRSVDRPGGDTDPTTPAEETVPLLSSLVLPDGTAYSFGYGAALGGITSMTLPTLGQIRWGYNDYPFDHPSCAGGLPPLLEGNRGVTWRSTRNTAGVVEGVWNLGRGFSGAPTGTGCYPNRNTTVWTPLGDRDIYYFTVASEGPEAASYGMPLRNDSAFSSGQALSHFAQDCNPDRSGCVTHRASFRRWKQDAPAIPDAFDGTQRNRREDGRLTQYRDDPFPGGGYYFTEVQLSDFDGLGHHRMETRFGNFGQGDHLEVFTDYDAATGTYPGPGWSRPGPSQPWVLTTYRQVRRSDSAQTTVVDFCFNRSTGYLLRKRLRASPSAPSSRDVVVSYPATGGYAGGTPGFTAGELYYGADTQAVATQSDLCSMPLPAQPQYWLRHLYEHGVESRSWWADANGASMGFYALDQTVDRNSGLVASKRDVAGMATAFQYDSMGRLLSETPGPGGGARVEYTYRAATGAGRDAVKALFKTTFAEGGTEVLRRSITYFDSFDRLWLTSRQLDSATWTGRELRYNAMGWPVQETEGAAAPGAELAAGNAKSYYDHDPFGRPRRIVHADGNEESITYRGIRSTARTISRGYYWTSQQGVVHKSQTLEAVHDRHGRLWKLLDTHHTDADWDGAPVTEVTEYRRDLLGRIVAEVDLATGAVRTRWIYDPRGFLLETDSEIPGWAGSASRVRVSYSQHDPLGNARLKVTTSPTPTAVSATQQAERIFDRAGRLVKVKDPGSPHVWRELVYASSNGTDPAGATDWRKGRLVSATRHALRRNGGPPSGWGTWGSVTTRYTYSGTGGRVSRLETAIAGSSVFFHGASYTQLYDYDDLGRVASWEVSGAQGEPGYRLDYTYDGDTLESALGTNHLGQTVNERWVVSQEHHPDGGLARIERGNGVIEVREDDGTSMDRTGRVRLEGLERWDDATGWTPYTWDSGTHEYDGRGALVRRGGMYLVPADWDRRSSEPWTTDINPCWETCVDPEDLVSISWDDRVWLSDHSGRGIAVYDDGEHRTIRDLQGRVVWRQTPFTEQLGATWYTGNHYVLSVYADGQLVGEVSRKVWDPGVRYTPPDEVVYVNHHRSSRVMSDEHGTWINDPRL